jgi:hypothetical protein
LYRQRERKLDAVVALQLLDRKRQRASNLVEKMQARVLVEPRIQPEHSHARAVIQRRGPEDFLALHTDER